MEQMYEESMYHGFISGSEMEGFEKMFENEDVYISVEMNAGAL